MNEIYLFLCGHNVVFHNVFNHRRVRTANSNRCGKMAVRCCAFMLRSHRRRPVAVNINGRKRLTRYGCTVQVRTPLWPRGLMAHNATRALFLYLVSALVGPGVAKLSISLLQISVLGRCFVFVFFAVRSRFVFVVVVQLFYGYWLCSRHFSGVPGVHNFTLG